MTQIDSAPLSTVAPPGGRLLRLNEVLCRQWTDNAFLRRHWQSARVADSPLTSVGELRRYPLVRHTDLLADQQRHPHLGTNRCLAPDAFVHRHHSAGTSGRRIHWGDTAESWSQIVRTSRDLLALSGVTGKDRVALAVALPGSSSHAMVDAGIRSLGCDVLTMTGGMADAEAAALIEFKPTVLIGRPFHLLLLATGLRTIGLPPAEAGVNRLILTGDNAWPQARRDLEHRWSAVCHDHYACTEAGSLAAECTAHPGGMHLLDDRFIIECLDPRTAAPCEDGVMGELVITSLLREEMPVIRQATGDLVCLRRNFACPCGRTGTLLSGGVRRRASRPW